MLIDDTADADASNTHGKTEIAKTKLDVKDAAFSKAKTFVETGGSIDTIKGKYELTKEAELILSKL